MRSVVRWATQNAPAMNVLMIAALIVGVAGMSMLRREMFPEFELEIVLVSVPYPGASPEETEEGICQKIEEAVRSIDGIKRQTAIAQEGGGYVVLELESHVNVDIILNEVRSEVDAIPSFPVLAEEPTVKQITYRIPAIRVGVIGEETDDPEAHWRLREITEKVRDDLVQLPSISQASILGAPKYQIDIEISQEALRAHGLSLEAIANIIRRENVELPGGTLRTRGQNVLLRGKNKHEVGKEIAKLPVIMDPSGDVITVGELGLVRDAFVDEYWSCRVDRKPGMVISVDRTKSEDLLAMAREVRQYVKKANISGYRLEYWGDSSVDVGDRMRMLVRNGIQGLVLVFIVLAVFLDLRLAFWVAIGIPVSIFGAGAVLFFGGETLNMLSMFAFLIALGIVVDDAIVIGENIYRHRELGKKPVRAAIDGTVEVLPSVFASIATTVIAFLPLMFVAGVMGKFFAVIPVAVIAMLVISLVEATLILPCHLSHEDSWIFHFLSIVLFPFRGLALLFHWINQHSEAALSRFIDNRYVPFVRWSTHNAGFVISLAIATLLIVGALIEAGTIPFVVFPKLDTRTIEARLEFPDGTPGEVTERAIQKIEQSLLAVEKRYGGGLVRHYFRMVGWSTRPNGVASLGGVLAGSHLGIIRVELVSPEEREVHSEQFIEAWRGYWREHFADEFPGVESLVFGGEQMGPGGQPIEFKLLSSPDPASFRQLEAAVEECKTKLASYKGVIDIDDDSRPGKWEYQIRVKESAKALGVTVADLAETVRAAYYGEEVMRLQRGRHEVKLMVRYPRRQRRSLAAFENIRVRTADGVEHPISELADIHVQRSYSEINRLNQLRSITVLADIEGDANAHKITKNLRKEFMPKLLARYPGLRVRWEGQQEQTQESIDSLMFGLFVAVLGMYALLTLEFRSYMQPLLILFAVPFGFIGAALGHVVMGLEFTLLSVFGMIALTGVVVNDAIVLIDFIDHRLEAGMGLLDALVEAGRRRFRPVILTSVTTVAGLTPMLLEKSFQGQVLIPMATSLAFGLMGSTVLVLVLIPAMYYVYARIIGVREPIATPDIEPVPSASAHPIAPSGVTPVTDVETIPR